MKRLALLAVLYLLVLNWDRSPWGAGTERHEVRILWWTEVVATADVERLRFRYPWIKVLHAYDDVIPRSPASRPLREAP